jgi:hypothetical protein
MLLWCRSYFSEKYFPSKVRNESEGLLIGYRHLLVKLEVDCVSFRKVNGNRSVLAFILLPESCVHCPGSASA